MLKKLLSSLSLCIIICFFLCSCNGASTATNTSEKPTSAPKSDSTQAIATPSVGELPLGQDMGQEYIDSFVFLGESTTSHLKNRGVLSGGTETNQVWSTKSGTLMLDRSTAECRIVYPETNEELDLSEATARSKPKYMLLTFGLNGAARNVRQGASYFKSCYEKLINTIAAASPNTVILLGSCFPVAENMDMSRHSVTAKQLNLYIDTLNIWTCELADEHGLGYINTASVLKDGNGFLREEYQVGDGYHLTKEAYMEILKYIRTHPYTEVSNES